MPDYHQPALMTIWGNGGRKLSNIIRFSFSLGTIVCFPTLFIWFFSIEEKDKWAFSLWTISNWLILSTVKISLIRVKLLTNYHACLYDLFISLTCITSLLRAAKPDGIGSRSTVSHIGMSSIGVPIHQLLAHEPFAAEEIILFQRKQTNYRFSHVFMLQWK